MSKTTKSIIIAASVIIVLIVGTIVISNIDTSKDNNVDTTDDLYSIYSADTTDILSVKAESEKATIKLKFFKSRCACRYNFNIVIKKQD